jgi:hypothetical protein
MTLKSFEPFTRLDAADLNSNNEFLQDQTVQPFADSAARGSAIATPADGQVTTLADDKNLQTYYGQYRPLPFAMEVGNVTITPVANANTGVAVTFAAGRFTQEPRIFTTADSLASAVLNTYYSNATTSGANIRVLRTNTTPTFVMYFAIQMTNGTANG